MLQQTFLFTTLPAGRGRDGFRLSVAIAPRLTWDPADGPELRALAKLGSDMSSWFEIAHAAQDRAWRVIFADDQGREVGAAKAKVVSQLDKGAWAALFRRELAVRAWAFQREAIERPLLSLPIADLEDWLLEGYTDAAGSNQPSSASIAAALEDLRVAKLGQGDRGKLISGRARQAGRGPKPEPPREDELGAIRQHDRLVAKRPDAAMLTWCRALLDPRSPRSPKPPRLPKFELHEILGLLSDHPALQRAIGLVVDLEIGDVPGKATRVRVEAPHEFRVETTIPRQWTALEPKHFRARSKDPIHKLDAGWLCLDDADFEVVELEAEQALLALAALAEAEGPHDSLPAVSSRGLSVVWSSRAEAVAARLDRAAELQEALEHRKELVLFAEDLTAGYAIDVSEGKAGPWRSLSARAGRYLDGRGKPILDKVQDELPVQDVVDEIDAETAGGTELVASIVDERLVAWTGWSLALPMPGAPMNVDGSGPETVQVETALGVRPSFQVLRGSLERLRYGGHYRFRARAIDLAGNAIEVEELDDRHATEGHNWTRWEPLAPPVRVPAGELGPGANPARIVIRTRNTTNPDQPLVANTAEQVLWLAPARVGVDRAEAHGVLDPPQGADPTTHAAATHMMLSAREHPIPERVDLGDTLSLDGILSDPIVDQVEVWGGDGSPLPSEPFRAMFLDEAHPWPAAQAVGLRLVARARNVEPSATWDEDQRTLEFGLAPADKSRYRLRSGGDKGSLAWFALLANLAPDPAARALELDAEGHPYLNPEAPLELVHAVQLPLDPPQLNATLVRDRSETFALLDGSWELHPASTGSVRIEARWEDIENAPNTDAGFERVPRSATILSQRVPESIGRHGLKLPPARHEFGDTRYRPVTYEPWATTRFVDCFPGESPLDRKGPSLQQAALATKRPATPELVDVVPSFRWHRQNIGVTKRSKRHAGLRVLLRGPWFDSGEGECLAVIVAPIAAQPSFQAEFVTTWGADPTTPDPALPQRWPNITKFPERDAVSVPSYRMPVHNSEVDVGVAAFPVHWDRQRQLWYADIHVDIGEAWLPFVRLSLARFQPNAIDGCALSPLVRADFVQHLPDRSLLFMRNVDGSIVVRVRAAGAQGELEARRDTGRIVVTIESRARRPQSDLGWHEVASSRNPPAPIGSAVRLRARPNKPPEGTLWEGTVRFNDETDPKFHRVVVREWEQVGTRERVVYFDALEF